MQGEFTFLNLRQHHPPHKAAMQTLGWYRGAGLLLKQPEGLSAAVQDPPLSSSTGLRCRDG